MEHETVVRLVAVLGKGPGAHSWYLSIKEAFESRKEMNGMYIKCLAQC